MTEVELITDGRFTYAVDAIRKVVDLALSYLGDKSGLHTGTREKLTNLKDQLPGIQSLVQAAENQQITNTGVETWLEQLKYASYEAEDVLDLFEDKKIRESIKGKGQVSKIPSSSGKMVKNLISPGKDLKKLKFLVKKLDKKLDKLCSYLQAHSGKRNEHLDNLCNETCSYLAPGLTIFGRDEEIKLILDKIFNVLDGDFNHKALDDPNLQQEEGEGSSSHSDKIINSGIPRELIFIPTVIKGAEQSKKSLLGLSESGKSMYSSTVKKDYAPEQCKNIVTTMTTISEPHSISNRKLAVIPIVGLGGVGKTTLAKIIYNDARVKEHFALKAWVYVPENCDIMKIMHEIYFLFGGVIDPLRNLQEMLRETIRKKRFLLILDNVSDNTKHIWNELESVLFYGDVGSVAVVTTQSRNIANTIRTLPEVTLDVLQPKSFWELFKNYAFGGLKLGDLNDQPPLLPSKQEELELIGKQIAEKLHRLPLMGEVIGTLLSTRLEKKFWEDICESDWWDIEGVREKILASIGVGYNYLEPKLKQCFAFCLIFPKQYEFEKERLVKMWIAQGFIQSTQVETHTLDKGEIRLEDIGRKCFGELVDKYLFQPSSEGKYRMHDLMRELAIAVSSNKFCFIESHDRHLPSLAEHFGIDCDNLEVERNYKDCTRVRTVILFGNWTNCSDKSICNLFAKCNGLRVLDLSHIVLETNEPINAICKLPHLRFVDLSFTGIKSLPDEFCALLHLEVLDVRGCNFEKLPEGMNQLINLRHLYVSSHTISLISGIGKLTKLQELEEFRIGEHTGHRISELMYMNNLSGHLHLSNLNNVSSKEEAAKSQLDKKVYLKGLELRFDYNDHEAKTEVQMEVLEALKPTRTLEILKVGGCRWKSFPGWVLSPIHGLYNLKVIDVYSFQLSSLPAFGELPCLELLSFDNLPLIEQVGTEFYGSSDVVFPSLKELKFSRMSSWRDWLDAEVGRRVFPHLKKLHLEKCSLLKKLPTESFTSLVELILSDCPGLCNIQGMPSIEVLHITDIKELRFVGGLKSLVNLKKLVIVGFHKFVESYEVEQENDEISQKKYGEQCLQFLTYMHLCHNKKIWLWPSTFRSLPIVGRLPSLHTLLIEHYPSKEYTRDGESWFNQLTSLENLEFRNCLWLRSLPSQLCLLTSLKKLNIYFCPSMLTLPENGLPPNLSELYIDQCPHLTHRYQPNQRDDWKKISHIPLVRFDKEIGTT